MPGSFLNFLCAEWLYKIFTPKWSMLSSTYWEFWLRAKRNWSLKCIPWIMFIIPLGVYFSKLLIDKSAFPSSTETLTKDPWTNSLYSSLTAQDNRISVFGVQEFSLSSITSCAEATIFCWKNHPCPSSFLSLNVR